MSGVTCHIFFFFFFFFSLDKVVGLDGGLRVCYQRGPPRLVYLAFIETFHQENLIFSLSYSSSHYYATNTTGWCHICNALHGTSAETCSWPIHRGIQTSLNTSEGSRCFLKIRICLSSSLETWIWAYISHFEYLVMNPVRAALRS